MLSSVNIMIRYYKILLSKCTKLNDNLSFSVLSNFSAADDADNADFIFLDERYLSCRACRDISHNAEYALREPSRLRSG